MNEPQPDNGAIRLTIDAGVATITLDAPERGNRFTVGAMLALIRGLERAVAEQSVVLVVRANGPDFTYGRDQSERPVGFARIDSLRLILRANALLRQFTGVSICLVQGHALGFGSGLALHSDITLAADDAVLGFDEILHGLAPLVVVHYLHRFVGSKVAIELLMTGRPVLADEAHALRMVNRVVPAQSLFVEGDALIRQVAARPRGAVRLMKQFAIDDAFRRMDDPQEAAIRRLDDWLSGGRPDLPSQAVHDSSRAEAHTSSSSFSH